MYMYVHAINELSMSKLEYCKTDRQTDATERITSGVTRMGDTRGGKWGCHPSIFFPEKPGDFFAHYRFLLRSLGCHPPRGCHPTPFLPVRPRFSTILCKFAHTIFFHSGVTPLEGVTRDGPPPPPPSDATAYHSADGNIDWQCLPAWRGISEVWRHKAFIAFWP